MGKWPIQDHQSQSRAVLYVVITQQKKPRAINTRGFFNNQKSEHSIRLLNHLHSRCIVIIIAHHAIQLRCSHLVYFQ